jgi:hypothetical protein
MRQTKKNISPPLYKWLKFFLLAAVLTSLGWGIIWATTARQPLPESLAALRSSMLVSVTDKPWLVFTPGDREPETGFIFYPGGRVDPRGYATLMNEIAANGYLVIVPSMPINMAVFASNRANEIIAAYPQIGNWVISGHSVGGVMAAQYTLKHPDLIDGLVIWAAYPANSADLSGLALPISSIYGTLDPTVNDASIQEREYLLPPDTQYVRIEGGDHHQFGAYLNKPEENHASISREAQHAQILEATLELLGSLIP